MIYFVDLYCGDGGISTGIIRAGGKVLACINHDPLAIESHKSNHKNVLHFTEDIRHFNVEPLARMVRNIRKKDPEAIICLWASLECIHFSRAKGGGSRDADSRTLAEHLYRDPNQPNRKRYIEAIDPDYIDIENVTEFKSWGPLRIAAAAMHRDRCDLRMVKSEKAAEKQGHPYHMIPASRKNGIYYRQWVDHICSTYGYDYDHRDLNAADFGARTSRLRYFGQFKKPHLPFTWPEATHAKNPKSNGGIGKKLKKWKAVRPALDLEDKGRSIFGRKKDLSPNSLKRIYAGLIKHAGDGLEPEFITKWISNNPKTGVSNPVAFDDACPTITTQNRLGVVQSEMMMDHYGNGGTKELQDPLGTITTKDKFSVVFMAQRNSGDPTSKVTSIENPSRTLTQTGGNLDLVFLSKYYGTGITHGVDRPADTLTTKDRLSVVWLDKQYQSEANHQSIDRPAGTILTNDKHCKVSAISINDCTAAGSVLTVPKSKVLSSGSDYYIYNPQYDSKGTSVDKPCFTLIARMDKAPPSIVEAEKSAQGAIIIYEDDSEITKKIKLFMASHGIVDIKMRMLRVPELLKIQGFGSKYILKGNQTDQKKFIGNSVPPELVKVKILARKKILTEYFDQLSTPYSMAS